MKYIAHYDFFNKNTYQVPQEKKNLLEVFKNRYAVVVALTVLMYAIIDNIYLLVGFGVVALLYTEYLYRNNFLKKLTVIPVEKVDKTPVNKQAATMNFVLYLLFGGLLGYFALTEMEGLSQIILIALSCGSVILSVRYLLTAISK